MPVNVKWFDTDESIILISFEVPWGWQEYYQALDYSMRLINASPYERIDVIVDFTHAGNLPSNALSHFRQIAKRGKDKGRMVVIIGATGLIKALMQIMMQLNRKPASATTASALLAPDLASAADMIQKQREIWRRDADLSAIS